MTLTFISHQWKSFWRSKNTGKSIAVSIVLGIFVLYMLLNMLVASYFLDAILAHTFPGQSVITSFCGVLLYYFLFDLLSRYQFQELPTLKVQPYLLLPIRRNQLINYLCFTSLWSGFTFAPFILTVPFLLKIVLPQQGAAVLWGFIGVIAGVSLFNHFFIIWLKRKENLNGWVMVLFLGILATLALLEFYWHVLSISKYSVFVFSAVVAHPQYSLIAIFMGLVMYFINYSYLKSNLYLEELRTSTVSVKSGTDYSFLNRFGKAGDLAANELKLILRNKRPNAAVRKGALILFYGLIFYTNHRIAGGTAILIFCPMLMIGMFTINYGQFMHGWQSAHFDGILVNKISSKDFIRSKFLLFTMFSTAAFILTTPYVYFGWKILMMHAVMYVWTVGVNTVLVLYFANMNYKRIDLSKSASFNWEGVGATQWILSIPLLIGPFIVYLPFGLTGHPDLGIASIAIVGVIFILTREFWLNILVNNFNTKRYKIAEGFRND